VAGQAHDGAAGLWHHRRPLGEARGHNYLYRQLITGDL